MTFSMLSGCARAFGAYDYADLMKLSFEKASTKYVDVGFVGAVSAYADSGAGEECKRLCDCATSGLPGTRSPPYSKGSAEMNKSWLAYIPSRACLGAMRAKIDAEAAAKCSAAKHITELKKLVLNTEKLAKLVV